MKPPPSKKREGGPREEAAPNSKSDGQRQAQGQPQGNPALVAEDDPRVERFLNRRKESEANRVLAVLDQLETEARL